MSILTELHSEIDKRAGIIRSERTDWFCRSGCEGCCHQFAEIPALTEAEWTLLREGVAELPLELVKSIGQDVATLAVQESRPIVCPLLDRSTGTCRVYLYRPIACLTYGFYVQRDKGLYCNDIESQVDKGELGNVVWGNQDAIDRQLKGMGDTRELTAWFANWRDNQSNCSFNPKF